MTNTAPDVDKTPLDIMKNETKNLINLCDQYNLKQNSKDRWIKHFSILYYQMMKCLEGPLRAIYPEQVRKWSY